MAVSFVFLDILASAPTPTPTPKPTPIKIPGKKAPTPTGGPIKIPGKKPTPAPTPVKIPGKKTTPIPTPKPKVYKKHPDLPKDHLFQLATATPTPPIKIPGKTTPTPTVGPIKIPGKVTPTPTPKILIPGKKITPTPTVKILIPGKKIAPIPAPPEPGNGGKGKGKGNAHVWINIDVYPPPPSAFGPPIIIPTIPVYHAVPSSEVNFVPGGVAPVPEDYSPPPQNAPVEVSPTALRGWNGQEEPPGRAFDQTQVKLAAASDGTVSWQFFWKTTGPEAQAARWEVATVPFVDGSTEFPPAGLVGYGDASINADGPLTENFFAVDFNGFAKNFEEGSVPNKYYMRVVPVDLEGNPIGEPSNFVRVDLP